MCSYDHANSVASWVNPAHEQYIKTLGAFEQIVFSGNNIRCAVNDALKFMIWSAVNNPASRQYVFCSSKFTSRDYFNLCVNDLEKIPHTAVSWGMHAAAAVPRIVFSNNSVLRFIDDIPQLFDTGEIKITTLAVSDKISINMNYLISEYFLTTLNPGGKIIHFS